MSLRFINFLAIVSVAISFMTIWTMPENKFGLFFVSGLLLSPLWTELSAGREGCGKESCEKQRVLLNSQKDFYLSSNNLSDYWSSSDPDHISNGGSNLVEWSDR